MFKTGDKVRRCAGNRNGWDAGEMILTVKYFGPFKDIIFEEIPDTWYAPYFEKADTLEDRIAIAKDALAKLEAEKAIQDQRKRALESVNVGDHFYLPADESVYVVTGNSHDGFVLVDIASGHRRSSPTRDIQKVFGIIHAKEAYQKVTIKVDYTPLAV